MAIIAPGTKVPPFKLQTEDSVPFTNLDIEGRTTVLVFYPFAFSSVCTDQFQVYEEAIGEIRATGADIYGVSTDASESQRAFRQKLGISIPQLSDFEPKGAASRAFGAYFEPAGFSNRALVLTMPDGMVGWSYVAENPGVLPGANLLFDGVAAARG